MLWRAPIAIDRGDPETAAALTCDTIGSAEEAIIRPLYTRLDRGKLSMARLDAESALLLIQKRVAITPAVSVTKWSDLQQSNVDMRPASPPDLDQCPARRAERARSTTWRVAVGSPSLGSEPARTRSGSLFASDIDHLALPAPVTNRRGRGIEKFARLVGDRTSPVMNPRFLRRAPTSR